MAFNNDGSFMAQYLAQMKEQEAAGVKASKASNDGEQQQQEDVQQQTERKASSPPPLPQPQHPPPESDLDFVPSSSFAGARPGFVFKMDTQGLGYYRDIAPHIRKQADAARAKPPAAIKSRSIVSIPLPRGGVAKKQKPDEPKSKYTAEMEKYKAQNCGSDTKHDRPLVK